MMQFENPRHLDPITNQLGEKTNTLEIYDSVKSGFSYLVHRTPSSQDKFQYDFADVTANFPYQDYVEESTAFFSKKSKNKDMSPKEVRMLIDRLLDQFYEGDIELDNIKETLTGSQYATCANKINSIVKLRQEQQAEAFQQEMLQQGKRKKVIWIVGESGRGKSQLAKYYASNISDNYYISGSDRDPFQTYKGERVVIFDELRPMTFPYQDLLKIMDPYNFNVLVPSRYFDKALTAETIIITTPYTPRDFYNSLFTSTLKRVDSIDQLHRRIESYIVITKDFITEYDIEDNGHYTPNLATQLSNTFYIPLSNQKSDVFKDISETLKNKP